MSPYAYPSAVKSLPAHCLIIIVVWCRSVHVLVPKCPCTNAEMSWCRTVQSLRCECRSVLVPKCAGSEVSGYHSPDGAIVYCYGHPME